MSIPFNDTTTLKGLVQLYEKECGFTYGDISGDPTKLKEFTAAVNIAFDDFWGIALPASGKWVLDDSNHTAKLAVVLNNLVSGTREYSILQDADNNLTLELYAVYVIPSATSTNYERLSPVDRRIDRDTYNYNDGQNISGIPQTYSKAGMTVTVDPVPNYSVANGFKALVNREPFYFTSADTTRKPGVPGIFHRYFFLKPAQDYARIHTLGNYNQIVDEINKLEKSIKAFFGMRSKDEPPVLRGRSVQHE